MAIGKVGYAKRRLRTSAARADETDLAHFRLIQRHGRTDLRRIRPQAFTPEEYALVLVLRQRLADRFNLDIAKGDPSELRNIRLLPVRRPPGAQASRALAAADDVAGDRLGRSPHSQRCKRNGDFRDCRTLAADNRRLGVGVPRAFLKRVGIIAGRLDIALHVYGNAIRPLAAACKMHFHRFAVLRRHIRR